MIDSIDLKSYCKINLGLDIIGKYEDGYHNLDMIMAGIDFYDEINMSYIEDGKDPSIEVSSDSSDMPLDKSNLCYVACEKLMSKYDINSGIVKIYIKKNIPMGAGLGGGSSNAATVLIGLNIMFGFNMKVSDIQDIASEIGADVPFLVANNIYGNFHIRKYFEEDSYYSFALSKGRGDILEEISSFGFNLILVLPGIFSSTAEVYSRVDVENLTNRPDIKLIREGIIKKEISILNRGIGNVLREPAEYNGGIADVRKYIAKKLPEHTFEMSGSGSSFFIISDSSIDLSDFRYRYVSTKTLSF